MSVGMTAPELRSAAAIADALMRLHDACGTGLAAISDVLDADGRQVLTPAETAFLELAKRIRKQLEDFDRRWSPPAIEKATDDRAVSAWRRRTGLDTPAGAGDLVEAFRG